MIKTIHLAIMDIDLLANIPLFKIQNNLYGFDTSLNSLYWSLYYFKACSVIGVNPDPTLDGDNFKLFQVRFNEEGLLVHQPPELENIVKKVALKRRLQKYQSFLQVANSILSWYNIALLIASLIVFYIISLLNTNVRKKTISIAYDVGQKYPSIGDPMKLLK